MLGVYDVSTCVKNLNMSIKGGVRVDLAQVHVACASLV